VETPAEEPPAVETPAEEPPAEEAPAEEPPAEETPSDGEPKPQPPPEEAQTKPPSDPPSTAPARVAPQKRAPLKPVSKGQAEIAAPPPSNDTVYALDARVDIPLFLIPGLLSVGWVLADTPADCAPLCDPAEVNGFDRSSAGNYDQKWRLVSDLTLFGALGGGIAVVLGDGWFVGGLQDLVVVVESVIWANGLAALGNLAVRRPRPLLYGDKAPLDAREDPAAALSFISGHSALVAALTTSVFSTTYRRDPDRALPWVILGVGTAATAMAGVGRVLAGRHFPSDVLIGTALGASTGFLLPAIHDAPVRLTPVVSQGEGRLIATASW